MDRDISKRKMGELLKEVGMITQEQLDAALAIQNQTEKRLGDILMELNFVTNDEIIQVLEFQLGIPHVNLEKYKIDQDACAKIPENIARRHNLIPISDDNGLLKVAMSDPLNVVAIDDVEIYSGMEVQPVIASGIAIKNAIDKFYSSQIAMKAVEDIRKEKNISLDVKTEDGNSDLGDVNNAPTVKLVNSIIEQAIRNRASDIHIEPFERYVKIRYRTDGYLYEVMRPQIEVLSGIVARIKILSGMDIAERRAPQDGRINIVMDKREYDLRISVLPTIYGEKIVIRIVDKYSLVINKESFGFTDKEMKLYDHMIKSPYGLILVSGPTGCGKTTTLYSAVNEINRPDMNIVTIEDPVEGRIDGINQIQVHTKTGLTFATGLRSILRQDPDVIMIGEIRDAETASIAVKSALTGHLVLSTIHTNDAAGSVIRLVNMGIEKYMVSSALVGVISQRLLRKVCDNCKKMYVPSEREYRYLKISTKDNIKIASGRGCTVCSGSGYKGRIGVYEFMHFTPKHRELLSNGGSEDEIRTLSVENGMNLLEDSAKRYVIQGVTSFDEFQRLSHEGWNTGG